MNSDAPNNFAESRHRSAGMTFGNRHSTRSTTKANKESVDRLTGTGTAGQPQKGGQGSARKARLTHDASSSLVGGGLGMALLPFGMVALDRWAAKKGKKTRKTKRRYRGGNGCTGTGTSHAKTSTVVDHSGGRRRSRHRGGTACTLMAKGGGKIYRGGNGCPFAGKGGGRRGRKSRSARRRRTRHRRRRTASHRRRR